MAYVPPESFGTEDYVLALDEIRLLLMEREKLLRAFWISIGCHILTAIYLTTVGIISLLK